MSFHLMGDRGIVTSRLGMGGWSMSRSSYMRIGVMSRLRLAMATMELGDWAMGWSSYMVISLMSSLSTMRGRSMSRGSNMRITMLRTMGRWSMGRSSYVWRTDMISI